MPAATPERMSPDQTEGATPCPHGRCGRPHQLADDALACGLSMLVSMWLTRWVRSLGEHQEDE